MGINDKLSVRAAISFTELTPWYEKYADFFYQYDMDFWDPKKHKGKPKPKPKKIQTDGFVDPFK